MVKAVSYQINWVLNPKQKTKSYLLYKGFEMDNRNINYINFHNIPLKVNQ